MVSWENKLLARFPWVVGILLAVLLADGLFYGLVLARMDSLSEDLKGRWDKNDATLAGLEGELSGLSDTVDRIADGKEIMRVLAEDILLTRTRRFVAVQEELAGLLKDNGVSSDKIGYGYKIFPSESKTPWGRRYLKTTFTIVVEGSYPQIKDLIRGLHNSDHFFVLEGITVNTSSKGATVLRASLQISTYFIYSEEDGILDAGPEGAA